MAGAMESSKEYLTSCHGVVRTPLAYIIRKTIIVQIYHDYPKYANINDEMITMMLHQSPNKNKLHNEQGAQSVMEHTTEYKIDNRSVYESWIRSARTPTCIHMSNSISPKGMAMGRIMLSNPGGWAQIVSMQQHQKLRWHCRCLCMMVRRRHGTGKSMLPDTSSTALSWETL